jgi:hypothetical protein
MKTIRISDEVWNAIAAQGKFGETEDIVLRRILNIGTTNGHETKLPAIVSTQSPRGYAWKQRQASDRLTQVVMDGRLVLQFDSGPKQDWALPPRNDIPAIRKVRDEAIAFVRENGGTTGQEHAAIRALTSRGYHVTIRHS